MHGGADIAPADEVRRPPNESTTAAVCDDTPWSSWGAMAGVTWTACRVGWASDALRGEDRRPVLWADGRAADGGDTLYIGADRGAVHRSLVGL